jgi:hypothetical protein
VIFAGRYFLLKRAVSMRDFPTIAGFRSARLLRRDGPVPGILAADRTGAIVDKSGRRSDGYVGTAWGFSNALR